MQNNAHGTMEATAIRAPGFGHRRVAYLEDLAAFTGGRVITPLTTFVRTYDEKNSTMV